jgi:predicted ATP-dependent endonuclease of OLD family
MELVYLWVEEYKNIRNQGFRFSPRFECEFDENTKELTINENKDYVSIFPNNINITAIVGENGSGKTNTVEAIISILDTLKNPKIIHEEDNKLFLVYENNKEYFTKKIKFKALKINGKIATELNLENNKCFSIYFNYTLDVLENGKTNFTNLYHRKDNYETPITMLPDKKGNNINIEDIEYHTQNAIVDFGIKENTNFSQIKDFFIPYKIKIELDKYKIIPTKEEIKIVDFFNLISEQIKENPKLDDKTSEIVQEEISNAFNESDTTSSFRIIELKADSERYLKKEIKSEKDFFERNIKEYSKNDWKKITKLYLISKLGLIDKTTDISEKINNLINDKNFEEKIKGNEKKLLENTKGKTAWEFYQELSKLNENEKPFNFKGEKISIRDNENFVKVLPSFLKCEIFDEKNISFNSLSYGQKFMMRFAYNLIYQLNNIKKIKNGSDEQKYTSVNLLLDEIEQGLHPDWQRKFIDFLIQVLKQFEDSFKFNIIITSHSPFIISDLPKENVIFLEKYQKTGYCKNVTKETNIETFGANIHTLLSHGFFMDGGLMGEFAKKTIQDVINYLDDKPTQNMNKQIAWQIIQFVGEAFLKHKLEEKYNEKFLTQEEQKQNKIKQLEDELKRLKDDNTQT